jgi:hypothetical protein
VAEEETFPPADASQVRIAGSDGVAFAFSCAYDDGIVRLNIDHPPELVDDV